MLIPKIKEAADTADKNLFEQINDALEEDVMTTIYSKVNELLGAGNQLQEQWLDSHMGESPKRTPEVALLVAAGMPVKDKKEQAELQFTKTFLRCDLLDPSHTYRTYNLGWHCKHVKKDLFYIYDPVIVT